MRGRTLAGAGLAVALALLGAACTGSSRTPPASGHPGDSAAGSPTSLLPATATALPTYDYATFRSLLAELRGTPVVVNVWASWCGPCIEEAPTLTRVSDAFAGRVQFVGVDFQDQLGPARAFVAKYGVRYPSVFDPSGSIRNGLGFIGQPITQVYLPDGTKDREGLWFSVLSEREITAELNRVLGTT